MKLWLVKLYGFYLFKIGNLSVEINIEVCVILYQVNVLLVGNLMQVWVDLLYLFFVEKFVDVCLLVYILLWCSDLYCLLWEVDCVLIDDGWMILIGFNLVSLMGLCKLVLVLCKGMFYNSCMFMLMCQLDWLVLFNFEVLYYGCYQVLFWLCYGGKLLSIYLLVLGCL